MGGPVVGSPRQRPGRLQALLLACVGALALCVAVWSGRIVADVTRIGVALEMRARWLNHAEQVRRDMVDYSLVAANSHTTRLPERLRHMLIAGELRSSFPLVEQGEGKALARWRNAAGDILKTGRELRERPDDAGRIVHDLLRAANAYDHAITEAMHDVRRSMGQLSGELGSEWSALYAMTGLSLLALTGLLVLLWKLRLQAIRLHSQEKRFRTLVETSQNAIWTVNATGHWTFINPAVREIYGYEPVDFLGEPFTRFSAPEQLSPDRDMLLRVLEGEARLNYPTTHLRKDGSRVHLMVNAAAIHDSKGRISGAMGTTVDVTALRQMQERQMRDERIRALGSLAGGVAHDFKNLLTVMVGQAELARTDASGNPLLVRRLESVLSTAERGRRLVEQLLGFAKNYRSGRGVIDLVAVVKQMEELIQRLTPGAVSLELVAPSTPVRVRGDWSQLEQVIVNLVLNARDALPEDGNGRISIRVKEREVSVEQAEGGTLEAGTWGELEVADDGVGMSEEVLSRAFEPFFTTKAPGTGTGLGLATVYNIVQHHGGTVLAESAPGLGTRFRVLLPLAVENEPASVA